MTPNYPVKIHYVYIYIYVCKGGPRTRHEGPEGEYGYSSTLSLTSALDGVGGQRHFTPRKDTVLSV
jgi:hypothetical protein